MEFGFIGIFCLGFFTQITLGKIVQIDNDVTYDNGGTQWFSTFKKRPIDAFLGIPYAVPPIGDLRFTFPQKIAPNGQRYYVGNNASNPFTDSICSQMDFHEVITGQEDCLHLHVYVPETGKVNQTSLPVMVWIHGGGFFAGSASPSFYGPEHLLDHDIILVSINYRVGPLSFLTLENDELPGNLALRDQILALEWIQENIKYFGGDPDKVTIAGESAGGMSVMYLLMTHLAKGLYSKGIIQSGPLISSYNYWDKNPSLYTKRFAKDIGCNYGNTSNTDKELLDCLRKIDHKTFAENTKHFLQYPFVGPNVWKPYFDGHNVSNAIFHEHPENLLRSGNYNKVPVIIGTNADEGALNMVGYLDGRGDFAEVDSKWRKALGPLILFHRSIDETTNWDKEMSQTVKDLYFGHEEISKDTLKQFIKLSGDHMFFGGTEVVVRELVKHSQGEVPTYRYMYSHVGSITTVDLFLLNPFIFLGKLAIEYFTGWKVADSGMGTCHADELFVMFQPHKLPFSTLLSAKDVLASERLLKYLVNFISSGDPNQGYSIESAHWEPATKGFSSDTSYEYFEIDGDEPNPEMKYDHEMKVRAEFWSNIHDQIYTRFKYLSGSQPKTMAELPIFSKRPKEDL